VSGIDNILTADLFDKLVMINPRKEISHAPQRIR
jgi:hypothetical protein